MREAAEPGAFAAVSAYVSAVFGGGAERVTAVDRFRDGNRHAVYKVARVLSGGRRSRVVVRISLDGTAGEITQAQREARVLEHLQGVGAPRLHDFRARSPWFAAPAMCMAFLPGDQRDLGSCTAAQVEQLGSLLGSLHRQPAGTLAQSLEATADLASYAHERWHSILAGLVWVRDPLPTGIQERLNGSAASMRTRWETTRNAAWFQTDETLALLHGDVGPGNLLWGPNPALIDWEYARLGDPADEIAYTLDQNGLTASQRHAFWNGYRQHAADQARLEQIARRVEWWERLTLLGSALWWAERFVRRAETDTNAAPDPAVPRALSYYLEQLTRRTQRLHDSLR